MRKILCLILALVMMTFMAVPGYASEMSGIKNDGMTGDVYAKYVNAVERGEIPVQNGSAAAGTEDGNTVSVSEAPANAAFLRVVSIPSGETAAWNWIAECIDDNITILSILDIYFEDMDGNRINASGVPVTITGIDEDTIVFAVATNGTAVELNGSFTGGNLSFTANGSHYYVLAKKVIEPPVVSHTVTVDKTIGGSVRVSSTNPKTGDTVTITVVPDAGKEVDKIRVKDADDAAITVTNHGNGVYSYIQPDSDVCVQVSFKDTAPIPEKEYTVTVKKPSGGTVAVSDMTPVAGQTVTIITKPDSGKVLRKITVTDAEGKTIKVTDKGDGTYSYVQPDSDVTIQVTFKNKSTTHWLDNPKTGDCSNICWWIMILNMSAIMLMWLIYIKRGKIKTFVVTVLAYIW